VGDVVAALAALLILGVFGVILVVMIRASRAQRTRTQRADFGGRNSYFGFLLGMLRATDRTRDEGEVAPEASGADADRRSRR
jgi:hypothetical protein